MLQCKEVVLFDQRGVTTLEKENLLQVHELFSSVDMLEQLSQILVPVGAAAAISLLVQSYCVCCNNSPERTAAASL